MTQQDQATEAKCPCDTCRDYFGWVHIRRRDNVWIDRPWCNRHDDICQPQKHGCAPAKEGGAK